MSRNEKILSITLSFFDQILGPQILKSLPEKLPKELRKDVLKFMNFDIKEGYLEGYIPHENIKIINYFIEIPSIWGRGELETLMLSLIVEHNFKFEMFQDQLEAFEQKVRRTPNVFKALYINSPAHSDDIEVKDAVQKVNQLISDTYEKLLEVIKNPYLGIFLTLGLSMAGKSTILHYLKTNAFKNMKPTLALQVIKILFDNKIFRTVDVSGQKQLRTQWWEYTKNPDAIIFVIDICNPPKRLREVNEELLKIQGRISNTTNDMSKKIPILICLNKIDLIENVEDKRSKVMSELNLEKSLNYKVQLTSAKEGTGITEGIKWIFQELLKIG